MGLMQGQISSVCDMLIENRENDFFNCVAITGMVRRGKSRLAEIMTRRTYPAFSYKENYIGNPKHGASFKLLYDSPAKSTCWIDEGEKILSSELRLTKEQWWLQQLFNQFASHNKTIILCTPTFRRIDSRWRDEHITIWIHIYRRGCGILLKKREMVSSHDVWGLDMMRESEMSQKSNQISDENVLKCFEQNPCSMFYFTFPDWDTSSFNEYWAFKKQSQDDLRNEFDEWEKAREKKKKTERANIALGRLCCWLTATQGLDVSEIGKLTGYSYFKIDSTIKDFVELAATDDEIMGSLPKKYFTQDVIRFIDGSYERAKAKESIK